MKTTLLRNLLTAVACMFGFVSAQAQFTGSSDLRENKFFSTKTVTFSLSEVATALGTDAATLSDDFTAWQNANEENPWTGDNLLFLVTPDNDEVDTYTCDGNGFFMTQEGALGNWNNEGVWYTYAVVDAEEDLFGFDVAISDALAEGFETLKAGDVAKASIKLKYNGKEVTFALTLNVVEAPVYEIPEPATLIEKELNVVAEKELTIHQYPRGGYDSDNVTVELADIVEKLGLPSGEILTDAMESLMYATQYNNGDVENGGGMKKDSLSNESTANSGFWFRAVQNADGEEDGECASAGHGDGCKFYAEAFAFDADANQLSCNVGQYPGALKGEETWFSNVYLLYGDKAYRVRITLVVDQKEQGNGLADYTKVGEETVVVEQEPTNDHAAIVVHPDMDAIAEALGCEVSQIGWVALDDTDNFAGSTANNGGFWYNGAGTVISYGTGCAIYIQPSTANNFSALEVGQFPNALAVGDEVSASVYFVNGDNYYTYTVTMKVIEPKFIDYGFESVATRAFSVQTLVRNDYPCDETWTMPLADIEALLGTTTPELYGLTIDSIAGVQGKYSNKYSCDPKPGFWLNTEGEVSVWLDANAKVGISYLADGTFQFFQHPNRNSVGDVFKTQLFLVNTETEKMITFNITVNFVDNLNPINEVGSANIVLPVSEDGGSIEYDFTEALEALGITASDLINKNNYYLHALTAAGAYGEGHSYSGGLDFDFDGNENEAGDLYYFTIDYDDATGKFFISTGSIVEIPETMDVNAQFCIEVDNQRYVFYVRFLSQSLYDDYITAVSGISAEQKRGDVYDLSGRRIQKPVRGLYIQQGKKVLVK